MASTTKVIVSVKVDDGSFESDVSWPVNASESERRGALSLWLAMLERAVVVAAPATPGFTLGRPTDAAD